MADIRLQDYLDDKFQTSADFETLDSLLDNVKAQQALLQKQLVEARSEHDNIRKESREHVTSLEGKAAAFQRQQADIDRTLMIITQSDASDEAYVRFDKIMDTLHRFDIATEYVEMLKEVDSLSSGCVQLLDRDIDRAVKQYTSLRGLMASLENLQEVAEGAAPHMIDLVAKTTESVRLSIRDRLSADLEKTLKEIKWPKADVKIPQNLQSSFVQSVTRMLDLQQPELSKLEDDNRSKGSKDEPAVLLPIEVMVQPLAQRFQYHFSGDRVTNRIDKPEYFFTHILELINDYVPFMQSNMQLILLKYFRGTDLAMTPAYLDVTSALITALLPMLRRKLGSILPEVSRKPNLLSSLIHEVMAFDSTLLDEWDYAPLSPSTPFRGLSHYVLAKLDYFSIWFNVERDFALSRYDAIITDRITGSIDYDSVDPSQTKPTKAAIRVNDLLETITDRYRTLSSFNQKMRFLIDIQISIFDRFHGRLNEGLEAYLTRTSTVARTVHGVSQTDSADISGVKGLDRLCRVYGSAEYLEKAMSDWSEDPFFLDLWEELQYRTENPGSIRGDLSMREIAAKTSSTINEGNGISEELNGALFDETAAAYRRLRIRSEQVVIDTINYDLRNALRPYSRVNTWASMSLTGTETSLTAELDGATRLLDEYLGFLSKVLGKTPLKRMGRHIGHSIQTFLWDSVLLRHSFSTAGALQFTSDTKGLWNVIDRHLGTGQGKSSMARLAEGLIMLALPVKGAGEADLAQEAGSQHLSLWDVERRIFASNESARDVLEEMGFEALSESEGREILKKRIEISS